MSKTNVYVDGFNLYYGAVRNTPYRWLDLSTLCHHMLRGDTIQSIKYFTAIVSGRLYDPQQPQRQQMYLRALRTLPNVSIIFGHFLTHSCRMVLTGSNPAQRVWVDKTEEKGSDVNIAAHLLFDGFRKLFDTAVLITNDSDLIEPVRIVRQELKLNIGILNPHQHHSRVLKSQATFMKRIRQSDLAACQFPSPLKDKHGSFHKPTTW
jgi:uncharacterized LabA/DUF88 family protein